MGCLEVGHTMINKAVIAIVAVMLLSASSCNTIPKDIKPMEGGTVLVEIPRLPEVQMPSDPKLSDISSNTIPTLGPVRISLGQGENQNRETVTSYRKEIIAKDGTKTIEEFKAQLGTNQHDKARDDWIDNLFSLEKWKARLASYRWMRWVGVGMILAAIGMFHPAVRAATGTTTQLATGVGGVLFIIAAQVMPGYEVHIAIGVLVGVPAVYWLRRHGWLQAKADENKNGIPDALEKIIANLKK